MSTPFAVALLAAGLAAPSIPQEPKSPHPPVSGEAKSAAVPATAPKELPPPGVPAPAAPAPAKPADASRARALAAAGSAFAAKDLLLFDTPREGEHWVRGTNYKASFDRDGIGFHAVPATVAAEAPSAHLHISAASVGGVSLRFAMPAPQRHDRRFTWERGPFAETVDVRPDAIEQSFTFRELPNRGELVLEIAATGSAPGEDRGDGFVLAGGAIGGTEAVAIDANGERVAAPTSLDGDRLVIRVPAEFVARAALPLVVDPVFASHVVATDTVLLAHPDVVWDRTANAWTVAYELRFGLNDTDLYVQRVDLSFLPVGAPVAVDITTNVWQSPSLANLDAHSRNLVVAQVSTDDPAPYWIGGRVFTGAVASATGQFDIEKAGVAGHLNGDKLHPDVGGDPSSSMPVYWTVVWERVYSTTDHDIHMKQVAYDGTLRSAAPTTIRNDAGWDALPAISKSDGPPPAVRQRHLVVWQHTINALEQDVHGALLTWDGQFAPVSGSNTFVVGDSPATDIHPDVSTSTDGTGTRWFLCTYEQPLNNGGRLVGSLVTDAGDTRPGVDFATLSAQPSLAWHPAQPRVECDGQRFTVVYEAEYGGSGGDIDTFALLLGQHNGVLLGNEPTWISATGDDEIAPAVGSMYSSTGQRNQELALVDEVVGASRHEIGIRGYAAYWAGNFTTRPTGCGQLPIVTGGAVGIGQIATFTLLANDPLTGFVIGFPAGLTTPVCPSCMLGVSGSSVMGSIYWFFVPNDPAFAGLTLSAQGWTFGGGPCLGSVSLSDTVDMLLL